MKGRINAQQSNHSYEQEMNLSFNKDFFLKSKYLMFAMGIASLYCVGYAIVLVHEFKKMGIINIVRELI